MRFLLDAASRPPFFLHALETANKVLMCSVESLPGTVNVGKKVIHHYKSKEEKTLHAHLYKLHRTGEKKKIPVPDYNVKQSLPHHAPQLAFCSAIISS